MWEPEAPEVVLPAQCVVHVKEELTDAAADVREGDSLQLVLNPSRTCMLSWDKEHPGT